MLTYQQIVSFSDSLFSSVSSVDSDEDAMLAWTNHNVNWWNQTLRERLGLSAAPLMPGSRVLVDRNWLGQASNVVLKGSMAFIGAVNGPVNSFAGLSFLPLTLQTFDEHGEVNEHEALALLDHLHSRSGELLAEQERALCAEAMRRNKTFRDTCRASDDTFVGALRLRYGYALTCHKAQGSEYEQVILHPHQPGGDARWLYTAVTRAKEELFTY